ncbi:Crp/Fnr family transcriptional regulator [Sphingobacterium suaedae]|uniref:Crp/Fnr family transcriptional regulator n=1 Tax=Sphingobacterium suaedae TaxID=1686402 RepID=A0ABW5KER1_9SPHI
MDLLRETYGGVLEPELILELQRVATIKNFTEGDLIIDYGQYVRSMPLLLTGTIKIIRRDMEQGDLFLYYLAKGDTCTMSIACCVGLKKSEIRAEAETETVVAMVPKQYLADWLGRYASWRAFILQSYAARMDELLQSIDNLAFMDMESRIVYYLQEKVKALDNRILIGTHQQIATELNTSRVVVSRILKKLEKEQKIVLLRNEIRVLF